jgi:membrane glycosyltransferase
VRRSASASTNVLARGMADSDLYPHATRSHNSCLDLFQTSVTVGVVCKILSNTVVLATCSALQSKKGEWRIIISVTVQKEPDEAMAPLPKPSTRTPVNPPTRARSAAVR